MGPGVVVTVAVAVLVAASGCVGAGATAADGHVGPDAMGGGAGDGPPAGDGDATDAAIGGPCVGATCGACPELDDPVIAELPLQGPIDLALVGSHAAIADQGYGLRVVDIDDLAGPQLIGGAALPDVRGLDVDGSPGNGHAFLASPSEGLVAYDLADLAHPVRGGSFFTTASDVVVAGGIAYVAAASAGLVMVDVRDPEHLAGLGRLPVAATERLDTLTLAGGRIYAAGGALVVVVDVADPTQPTLLGRAEAGGDVVDLELLDGRTYASVQLADGHALEVLDLRDPAQPRLLASHAVLGAGDLAVVGTTIYLPAGGKVDIIDAADPDALVWRGAAPGVAAVRAVIVDRDHALIADDRGLSTVPLSRARWADVTIGELDIGNDILDLVVDGPLVHVAASRQGLIIVDASRPEAAVEVGRYRPNGAVTDVELGDDLAYVVVDDRLDVVDVGVPAEPFAVGSVALRTGIDMGTGMTRAGDRVYVATRDNEITIIDVHDPGTPTAGAVVTTDYGIRSLTVAGRFLHVLHLDRLTVVDLEAAGGPAIVGRLPLDDYFCEDAVTDGAGTLYAACGSFVHVIDVSTPGVPAVLGAASLPFRARRIVRDGDRLHVAAAKAGVIVVDVGSPSAPVITDRFPTAEPARAIGLLGTIAVIAIGPGYDDRLTFRAMCAAP